MNRCLEIVQWCLQFGFLKLENKHFSNLSGIGGMNESSYIWVWILKVLQFFVSHFVYLKPNYVNGRIKSAIDDAFSVSVY